MKTILCYDPADRLGALDASACEILLRHKGYEVMRLTSPDAPLASHRLSGADVLVVYHSAAGAKWTGALLEKAHCRKVLIFFGAPPARLWKPYSLAQYEEAEQAQRILCALSDKIDLAVAVSPSAKKMLEGFDFRGPIEVRPPLFSLSEYSSAPDAGVLGQYGSDGYVNFLCVGSIEPHRSLEDAISLFAQYQFRGHEKSRLLIVGAPDKNRRYLRRLERYVQGLQAENVLFTGQVPFATRLSYYHVASLFLYTAQHESFSVPLMEAAWCGVPILALDSTAAREFLGKTAAVTPDRSTAEAERMCEKILTMPDLRRLLVSEGRARQQMHSYSAVRDLFEEQFSVFLETVPPKTRAQRKKSSRETIAKEAGSA